MTQNEAETPKVSIIIPTLNEEEGIGETIRRIPKSIKDYSEIIVVDGLSEDNTVMKAIEVGAKIVFEKRAGKGEAMRTGALSARGEILVFIDGDGTYPSENIPEFVDLLGKYELVIGNAVPFIKQLNGWQERLKYHYPGFLLSKTLFSRIGVDIEDPLSGMRAIRKINFERLDLKSNGFEIEAEMNLKAKKYGLKIVETPIKIQRRGESHSKFILDIGSQINILRLLLSNARASRLAYLPHTEGLGTKGLERSRASRYLSLGLAFFRSRILTERPFFLAHSTTYACNSRCKTCTQWRMSNKLKSDLSTEEVFSLLDSAYAAGMRGYYAFGGEPLLRKDIAEILEFAKKKGYVNTVNTNGSLLEKKAKSISENVDFIFVSLDYPNEYNDFIRGRKGSFREVIEGTKKILQIGKTKVVFVTTISKLNFDKIEDMSYLAQKLGIGISYNAVEPTFSSSYDEERTFLPVEDYGLSESQLKSFYLRLLRLKQRGYPLMESKRVLYDYAYGKPFKCHFPKIFVYVSPEGQIFPCSDNSHSLVNMKKTSFEKYFSSIEYKNHVKRSESCKVCIRTCVRMYSYTYALKLQHMLNLIDSSRLLFQKHSENEQFPKIN